MHEILTLLRPRHLSLKNYLKDPGPGGKIKFIFILLFTFFLLLLILGLSFYTLKHFRGIESFGESLCKKLLNILWVTGAVLLLFSAIINSLSNFFLAKDLSTIMASPIKTEFLFWARSILNIINSSWMPVAFLTPIFIAYGLTFKASISYYLLIPIAGIPIILISCFLSQILIMILINILPAKRTKDIMSIIILLSFCLLYVAFRIMRPEQLFNPSNFVNAAAYLETLKTPSSSFMPTYWATELLWPYLIQENHFFRPIYYISLLWTTAISTAIVSSYFSHFLYWSGYNKSIEGSNRIKATSNILDFFAKQIGYFLAPQTRSLTKKEIKIFFRDNTQWSQLLLLTALFLIYIYNFSVLDFNAFRITDINFVKNLIAIGNVVLVALVSATLSLRFAFPSISSEGFSYWIIRSSPLSLRNFIWIKFKIWLIPILTSSTILIIISNSYLKIPFFINISTVLISIFLTPGLCALGIGLGAKFPRFETENLSQISTGYGGLIYMLSSSLSSLAIIFLWTLPILHFNKLIEKNTAHFNYISALYILMAILALILCYFLVIIPINIGSKALTVYNMQTKKE